ncbi:sulfurtransferase-like selenium metabolism protein YedF [Desulfomarina sp.]
MKTIDARGLACPAPVLETKTILETENPDKISVTVDNPAAQQNVQRFLESQGFETLLEQQGDDYFISGSRDSAPPQHTESSASPLSKENNTQKIMVMCATDSLGSGDDELGRKLMTSFLRTLEEMGEELWQLVFVNSGVKLTITGSEVLDDLKKLEKNGTTILVCGTCLTHFDLLEKKQAGVTTNMLDIVTAMQLADKVINV